LTPIATTETYLEYWSNDYIISRFINMK